MPRVKLNRPKRDAPLIFRELIAKNLCKENIQKAELAERVHMPISTLYYKYNNPKEFRFDEVTSIIKTLRFSQRDIEELAEALGGQTSA